MSKYYPLLFKPMLKDYIWGGRNLEKLGRTLPADGVIAESWEIAGHADGTTVVSNGRYEIEIAGKPYLARASLRPMYDQKGERVRA